MENTNIIIISPWSRALRNGLENPKNFPYWDEVVRLLKTRAYHIIQVGVQGERKISGVDEVQYNLPLYELSKLIKKCFTFICVDNFFPHLAHLQKKPGVVIFAQSDPVIFGYPENTNLLKDRSYLREHQYDIWEATKVIEEAFVSPETVIDALVSKEMV